MLPSNMLMLSWETYGEDTSSLEEGSTMTVVGLLDQLNVTRDNSDYLWYITRSVSLVFSSVLGFSRFNCLIWNVKVTWLPS